MVARTNNNMSKRPRGKQADDSDDEFSDLEDEDLGRGDTDDEDDDASSDDDDDAAEYAAALAELSKKTGNRVPTGEEAGDDDDDEDASDSDAEFAPVEERTTKKGRTVYHVTLCPETAPFTTRAAADEFMRSKAYETTVKRELRSIKAARKGLREFELTDEQKSSREAKKVRAREKRHTAAKARKKARPLSDEQIAARKAKFQRKKERRAARKAAA